MVIEMILKQNPDGGRGDPLRIGDLRLAASADARVCLLEGSLRRAGEAPASAGARFELPPGLQNARPGDPV